MTLTSPCEAASLLPLVAVLIAVARRSSRGQQARASPAAGRRRHRHDLRQHLQGHDLRSSTKPPRSSRGEIPVEIGIPVGMTFSDDRSKLYVQDVTFEKVEIIDRVKGTSLGTFTLTEGKAKTRIWGLRPDPHDKYLILVIKKYTLRGRPLGDRPADAGAVRPGDEEDHAHDSVAEGRGARGRRRAVLAGRQAHVHVRRGHPDLRDRRTFTRGRQLGSVAADRAGRRPRHVRRPRSVQRRARASTPASSRCRIRCRTGASWASAASSWRKKKIDFHPIGPARGLGFAVVARSQARATGCSRTSTSTSSGRSTWRTTACSRARRSAAGRAWAMRVSSNGNVHLHPHGRQHDRSATTRRRFKLLRTITLDGDMTSFTLAAARRAQAPTAGR